ncbi:hypothetical protein [Tuwongella immobilis]|uniref:Uncharacterized protein n=1 Tax=Tuwongella immobilis TaxID=692036 RepID=A0A6C2YWG3_9BACT|nr:hypothetical protein [Tuwongella immobilis]VIP05202.1 unnamed protein product [Tuwongella immobilis]VTS07760.1 unnamed protein product [Tuwongella immobilis]
MESCFLCRQPVMGLKGQDDFLDSAILDPGDEPHLAEADGECHGKCLTMSPWGEKWMQYRIRRQQRMPFVMLRHHDSGLISLHNRNNGDTTLFRADGTRWVLRDRDTHRIMIQGSEGYQLPLDQEFNCVFREKDELLAEMQSVLRASGRYSLMHFLQALGTDNRLLHPATVADSEWRFDSDFAQYWTASSISARLVSALFVPMDVYFAWLSARKQSHRDRLGLMQSGQYISVPHIGSVSAAVTPASLAHASLSSQSRTHSGRLVERMCP